MSLLTVFINLLLKIQLYLFMAVLGLFCCLNFSLVVASRAYFLVATRGLLTEAASLVAEHRLDSCGTGAQFQTRD